MVTREPVTLVVDDETPGRTLLVGDIRIGDRVEQRFAFDAGARLAFARLANDRAPVHGDDRFAAERGFEGQIIQGLCVSSRFSRLIGMYLPGQHAILESISLKYRRPTFENQPIVFRAEAVRVLVPLKVVRLALWAGSELGVHVEGEAQCLLR